MLKHAVDIEILLFAAIFAFLFLFFGGLLFSIFASSLSKVRPPKKGEKRMKCQPQHNNNYAQWYRKKGEEKPVRLLLIFISNSIKHFTHIYDGIDQHRRHRHHS